MTTSTIRSAIRCTALRACLPTWLLMAPAALAWAGPSTQPAEDPPTRWEDFVALTDRHMAEGVTPENNAVVLLLQAVGPRAFADPDVPDPKLATIYERLGIKPLPAKGDYFIPLEEYVKANAPPELLQPTPPTKPWTPKQLERFRKSGGETVIKIMELMGHGLDEEDTDRPSIAEKAASQDFMDARGAPWRPADKPMIAGWLTANSETLDMIVAASRRRRFYYPLLVEEGPFAPTGAARRSLAADACKALVARAMLRFGAGKFEVGRKDLRALVALAIMFQAGTTDSVTPITRAPYPITAYAGLATKGKLTSQQARECIADLADPRLTPAARERMNRGDRRELFGPKVDDAIEANQQDEVTRFYDSLWRKMLAAESIPACAQRKAAWDKLLLETFGQRQEDEAAELLRILKVAQAAKESLSRQDMVAFLRMGVEGWQSISLKMEGLRVYRHLTRTALALAAYKADHGSCPDRLDQLKGGLLPEFPVDFFSGKPLRYVKRGGGYLLYSVGKDMTDSLPDRQDDRQGDDLVICVE